MIASYQQYYYCFVGIIKREMYRVLQQRSRLLSSLVRPLLWLTVFAAGLRSNLGTDVIPPYEIGVSYETYIAPGLIGIILLFNGMQGSLSMVYDREMGSMRVLLTSPIPRSYLLVCKLLGISLVSLIQVYVFIAIARLFDITPPLLGYVYLLPAALLPALMIGALGLFLSSIIRQLENFAGVVNFIVFPMFFLSSALYPLWKMRESNDLIYQICALNPFTHGVELIRFALYGQLNLLAFSVCAITTLIFLALAILGYDPKHGLLKRKAGVS